MKCGNNGAATLFVNMSVSMLLWRRRVAWYSAAMIFGGGEYYAACHLFLRLLVTGISGHY